ncbi:unnamed protein product [Durusdinium trenchii]|uniref:Uncharacterized protein n=2 Tax=Durusdinium trenchii TaxID=1381693 RepID=A0ABP0KGQ2_9DINO
MSENGSKRSSASESLEQDVLLDLPEESLQRPNSKGFTRRDSISSASLGFDDLDDFCAPASLKATEKQMRQLRRCIKHYEADGEGPFEDHVDPYFHELVGLGKVRAVGTDNKRLQQFISETVRFESRNEEVKQKTRNAFNKVRTALKLAGPQEIILPELPGTTGTESTSEKPKRRNSTRRRSSAVATKLPKKVKDTPKEKSELSKKKKQLQ